MTHVKEKQSRVRITSANTTLVSEKTITTTETHFYVPRYNEPVFITAFCALPCRAYRECVHFACT